VLLGGEGLSEKERVGEGRVPVEEVFEVVVVVAVDDGMSCWDWVWEIETGKKDSGIGIGSVKAGMESQSFAVLRESLWVKGSD
jgi:hypothetical protein